MPYLCYLAYLLSTATIAVGFFNFSNIDMGTVAKSYHNSDNNSVIAYCGKHTIKQHPLQEELTNSTLENAPHAGMLGAPEVLTLGENFIHLIGGKKALDIGTFTGASALAWALATGEGGKIWRPHKVERVDERKSCWGRVSMTKKSEAQIPPRLHIVYTFDISFENYKKFGLPIISKDKEVLDRIVTVEGPALDSLDRLIAEGNSGTFDFAFIDADKQNYTAYYDRAVTLLRKGGVIMIDNALWHGRVAEDPSTFDNHTKAIDDTNKKIYNDDRTYSALINTGDGTHIAFKK